MENNVDFAAWLTSVVGLFNGVYRAVMSLPVLRFILVALLFLVAVSLLAWLIRRGAKRKL